MDTSMMERVTQFHARVEALSALFDWDVLGDLAAEYIEYVGKMESMTVDEAIAELTRWAVKKQEKRRSIEQRRYFKMAQHVAAQHLTLPEACHFMAKHFYVMHHQVKGAPEIISQEYNALYDRTYSDAINARQARAAKDLFGG